MFFTMKIKIRKFLKQSYCAFIHQLNHIMKNNSHRHRRKRTKAQNCYKVIKNPKKNEIISFEIFTAQSSSV